MLRYVVPYEFIISETSMIQDFIEEVGNRIISFSCEDEIEAVKLYLLLQKLERLLQIFDGVFLDLADIVISGRESNNSYNALVEHLKIQRLHYFSSASFISIYSDRLLKYEDILSVSLLNEWQILLDELGVVNQMYLYAASAAGFTNDVKCAFLVELSESLIEIIGKESTLYAIKMSYLFRLVILEKLKMKVSLYEDILIKRVSYMDSWNGIQEKFFNRLK